MTSPAVRVDRFNAFCVNQVGLDGPGFPLSISVEATDGLWAATGTAVRAFDLVDVLAASAYDIAVVLNIGHNWFGDGDDPIRPREIARRQGVRAHAHDITWATFSGHYPSDLLMLRWRDLDRLLDGWSCYDIDIIDVDDWLWDAEVDELVLAVNTRRGDAGLLRQLPRSRVVYGGHDDCYFQVESVDATLPARLLTRLLALLAGSALLGSDRAEVTVAEPDWALAERLLHHSRHWVGRVVDHRPGRMARLGLAPAAWRLGEPIATGMSSTVVFDLTTGAWSPLR